MPRTRLLLASLLLGLAACPSEAPDAPPHETSTDATGDSGSSPILPEVLDAEWVPDADTPTFVTVSFPSRRGTATLTWTDLAGSHTMEGDAELGQLRILGVPAGSQVVWSLSIEGPSPGEAGPSVTRVPPPPEPLRQWSTTQHDEAEAVGAWLLTTQFDFNGRSFALLVDDAGRIRWWREARPGHRIYRIHPGDDGQSLVWISNTNRSTDEGIIVREPLDGSPPVETAAPSVHHDFVEHADGFAFLAHVDRDMALEPGGEVLPMTSDAIRLVDEGATGAYTDVFSFFDDWPAPVSQPCSHSHLGAFVPGRIEWTHSNSLVRDEGGDGWWILARYLDQVARVHSDGRLAYILGGLDPTLTYTGDGLPLAHGHMSQVTEAGTLLVFSNGEHDHRLDGSKVVELAVDEEAGTVSTVWTTPEPEGRFVGFLGDARRLPGGHTMIVSPNQGVYEVTAEGEVVWEAHHDPEGMMNHNLGRAQRVDPLPPYGP